MKIFTKQLKALSYIDSYRKLVQIKLYDSKLAITTADTLNDRGSECCDNPEQHEFVPYLDLDWIEHTRTKSKSTLTNGICERFDQIIQNVFSPLP